jgi:hypothetical protein
LSLTGVDIIAATDFSGILWGSVSGIMYPIGVESPTVEDEEGLIEVVMLKV